MSLPTALSVQADIHVLDELYVNAVWMQRLVSSGPGLDRANYLALTPRLERKWYDVSFPFILYQYKYPRIGFAISIAYFSIGSDNISTFFIKKQKTGWKQYLFIFKIRYL